MISEKSIFIHNDFEESDLYWVVPTVYQIAKKKNIKKIFSYQSIITSLRSDSYFKNNDIELIDIRDSLPFYLKEKFKFIFGLVNFFKAIIILKNLNKIILNRKISWQESQFYHSILDTINVSRDKNFEISILKKTRIVLKCLFESKIGNYLNKKNNFSYAFIGNSVYYSRIYLAIFRSTKTKVVNQAQYNLYLQPRFYDASWGEVNNKIEKKLKKKFDKHIYLNYFDLRSKGKGLYADSQSSFSGKKIIQHEDSIDKNYIFLHVFKDSPFNIIDRSRLFIDYFEWIEKTLEILKDTNEKWFIKIHPSSKVWGEDSMVFLKNLKIKNKNINLLNKKITNDFIFRNSKRIITFSGTSYLEAISYGLKPIIISTPPTFKHFYKYVFKPKNISHYKKLLTDNLNSNYFRQKNKISEDQAKKFIFIRENVLTNFKDFNAFLIYKNVSSKKRNQLKNIIRSKLLKRKKLFNFYAENLLKYNHTFSEKFRDIIK